MIELERVQRFIGAVYFGTERLKRRMATSEEVVVQVQGHRRRTRWMTRGICRTTEPQITAGL